MLTAQTLVETFGRHPLACGLIVGSVTSIAYTFVKLANNEDKVMFFSKRNAGCAGCMRFGKECRQYFCSYGRLKKILGCIKGAKTTLDICVLLITIDEMMSAIVDAHKRGVRVRFICDSEQNKQAFGGAMKIARQNGIEVRELGSTSGLMHPKNIIIDRKIVLHGSMNFTMQGLCGNFENMMIIRDADLAEEFTQFYETLWNAN